MFIIPPIERLDSSRFPPLYISIFSIDSIGIEFISKEPSALEFITTPSIKTAVWLFVEPLIDNLLLPFEVLTIVISFLFLIASSIFTLLEIDLKSITTGVFILSLVSKYSFIGSSTTFDFNFIFTVLTSV